MAPRAGDGHTRGFHGGDLYAHRLSRTSAAAKCK